MQLSKNFFVRNPLAARDGSRGFGIFGALPIRIRLVIRLGVQE
jgi:hypothetical protein